MSAFLVSDKTVNIIVSGAIKAGMIPKRGGTVLGKKLLRANIKSLRARYGESNYEPTHYKFKKVSKIDAQIVYSVQCLEYQSCEYSGYQNSDARKLALTIGEYYANKLGTTYSLFSSNGYGNLSWD